MCAEFKQQVAEFGSRFFCNDARSTRCPQLSQGGRREAPRFSEDFLGKIKNKNIRIKRLKKVKNKGYLFCFLVLASLKLHAHPEAAMSCLKDTSSCLLPAWKCGIRQRMVREWSAWRLGRRLVVTGPVGSGLRCVGSVSELHGTGFSSPRRTGNPKSAELSARKQQNTEKWILPTGF